MNILMIVDTPDWAINRLAQSIIDYNERHNFYRVFVHPRNVAPAIQEINKILRENKIDLIHGMYWRSATQVIDYMKDLKEIPAIVSHHNTAHLMKEDWNKYFTKVIAPTKATYDLLDKIHDSVDLIPYGINLEEFQYISERTDDKKTVGYIGRILPHKNLAKICKAAQNSGFKVLGSGYIDKPKYWEEEVKQYAGNVLEFRGGNGRGTMNSWEDKNKMYESMTVYAMLSSSYETGPLPLFEAMARGVPVITTKQGMGADFIEDGQNGIVCTEENFEQKLNMLMNDRNLQEKLRRNARKTIQQYTEQKMAVRYGDMYSKVIHKDEKLVSIIVPTCDRLSLLTDVIHSIQEQTYDNIELIIVDDGSNDETKEYIAENKSSWSIPVKYINQNYDGYGLAQARNRGIVEARGELLVFLDDRLKLSPTAIEEFAKNTSKGQWNFGVKFVKDIPSKNSSFVENFSAVHRKDVVSIGMFNERIEWYGGMSQDIRTRCKNNSITHTLVSSAHAHQIKGTAKMKKPNEQWKSKLLLWKIYG